MHKYFLFVSAIVAVWLSAVISIIPIGMYNQWQVSALLPTLFTPATYTFWIWSLIYLSWIVLWCATLIWSIHISPKNTYLLSGAQVLSSLWLIPAQYFYIATSLCVMLVLLFLLTKTFLHSQKEPALFRYTLELFFWWIVIASIANIHLTLVDYDVYFFPVFLTSVSIILGCIINLFITFRYKAFIAPSVFIWSAIWIIAAQTNIIIVSLAGITACSMFGVMILFSLRSLLKKPSYNYLK